MKHMRPALYLFVGLLLCCLIPVEGTAANYSSLLSIMQVRQGPLEATQLEKKSCLGERLDGFLEINNCSPEITELADAENRDRKALFELMATSLGTDVKSIGVEWAKKRHARYIQPVMRQIRLKSGRFTYWNGIPPHPDEIDVARVLTQQYARIYSEPSTSSSVVRDNLPLYEAFGVVTRKEDTGRVWYQVTEEYVPKQRPIDWNPKTIGWIADKDVIPWKRALVMRFTSVTTRKPSIFFKTSQNVFDLTQKALPQRQKQLDALYADLNAGHIRNSSDAVAVEPSVGSDQQQMVMYPVLDYYGSSNGEKVFIGGEGGIFSRILKVAAQTRGNDSTNRMRKGNVPIDIVFVMDLTNSMKPYLEKLLSAINSFVREVDNQNIRFGFIGYQDKHPDFEFIVKPFTSKVLPPAEFARILTGIEARQDPVTSDDIPEAVMEGVNLALDSSLWRERSAKCIFLIGDAPGREEAFTVRELQDKLNTRKIPLISFYIDRSRGAKKYNKQGKKQYRELSVTWEGAYGTSRKIEHLKLIDGGSYADFESKIFSKFQKTKETFENILEGFYPNNIKTDDSISYLIFQQAALLLADPSMPEEPVTGWVADKVLDNPGREALAPMVLLNETELDELEQRVRELKNIGEMALRGDKSTTPDFFDLVDKNTRFTIVNPSAVNFRDAFNVPLGIDTLPYKSQIMRTTRDEFENEHHVKNFIDAMANKLRHYEDLKRQLGNPDVWKKLSTGTSERDRVVGLELDQLP